MTMVRALRECTSLSANFMSLKNSLSSIIKMTGMDLSFDESMRANGPCLII